MSSSFSPNDQNLFFILIFKKLFLVFLRSLSVSLSSYCHMTKKIWLETDFMINLWSLLLSKIHFFISKTYSFFHSGWLIKKPLSCLLLVDIVVQFLSGLLKNWSEQSFMIAWERRALTDEDTSPSPFFNPKVPFLKSILLGINVEKPFFLAPLRPLL